MMHRDDQALASARDMLRPAHELYTSTISSKGMALSLETAAFVWSLCEERKPSSILDLGSGFSSYVVRQWAKTNRFYPSICSVDDDANWLLQSQKFCNENGVDSLNFREWNAFFPEDKHGIKTTMLFDLVIYYLGRMQCRSQNLRRGLQFRSPMGVVVVDDMHKFNYAKEVKQAISDLGLVGHDMREATTDAHEGRHCWLVTATS